MFVNIYTMLTAMQIIECNRVITIFQKFLIKGKQIKAIRRTIKKGNLS